jgi:hypothetical protein
MRVVQILPNRSKKTQKPRGIDSHWIKFADCEAAHIRTGLNAVF